FDKDPGKKDSPQKGNSKDPQGFEQVVALIEMGHPKEQGPNGYRGQEAPFGIPEDLPEEKAPIVEFLEEGGSQDIDPKLVPSESMIVFKDQGKANEHGQAADQG